MLTLENEITYPFINEFLSGIIRQNDRLLCEMEEYARKNNIPVIQRESARFLELLCLLAKPRRILEIGTAIGYSAIVLAKTLNGDCIIDTVEIDEDMVIEANGFIQRSGLDKAIRVVNGDAAEVLQCLTTPYDFIFLDAAKGQYMEFLPHCLRLLNAGGLLITDNILYRGMVAKEGHVEHKHRTITVRLRKYIDEIMGTENLTTSIVPIGDGLAVSLKRNDGENNA